MLSKLKSLKINRKESNVSDVINGSKIFNVSNSHNNKKQIYIKLSSSTSSPVLWNLQHNVEEILNYNAQDELDAEVRARKIVKLFESNRIKPLRKMLNSIGCASHSNGKMIASNAREAMVNVSQLKVD